jgi:photosystem II stability/assembly factor-like uncharacterized protein
MKYLILHIVVLFSLGSIEGQTWKGQVSPLKEPFEKTMEQLEVKFSSTEMQSQKVFKHYQRWKGEMDYKMTPNQPLQNFNCLNYIAYQKEQKKLQFGSQSREAHGAWEDLGPFDYSGSDAWSGGGVGRVNCTAFHPTNSAIMWVGTASGGLWKTTDNGSSWSPMTDHLPSISISDIAIHPTNPDIIYILTGDGDTAGFNPFLTGTSTYPGPSSIGVLKTEDGGAHWKSTGLTFQESTITNGYRLLIHPSNPDTLIVGMNTIGIFRTIDAGDNWTQVDTSNTVWDLEFQPGNPQVIYGATLNGFQISTDAGATWNVDNDPSFPGGTWTRVDMAISPSAPTNVYLVFGTTAPAGTFGGVYKSTTSGDSFSLMANTPNILANDMSGSVAGNQASYDLSIAVDPMNDSRVFVGSINCWKSEDNGVTWGRETWWTRSFHPFDPYVHADFHNLYFRGGTLFANNDGGIYKTNDFGNSWTELSSGLSIMMFYDIDILGNEYIGGAQDNGTNGSNFSDPQTHQLWGGDGFGCVWHTGNNTIQYISNQTAIYRRQFGTSVPISPIETGTGDHWHAKIDMHTTDPDYVFAATFNELYRGNGNNFEFSWDSLGTFSFLTGPNNRVFGFSQCTADPNTMYVVNQNKVLRTNDLNLTAPTWTTLSDPTSGAAFISNVVVDPANAARAWIVCSGYSPGNKVFFLNDTNWTNLSGSLPNVPIRCIGYQPGSNDGLYIGTDIGVYYTNATMSDWIYFSNLLPNTIVRDIEISSTHVYAGTWGRGIWRSELYSTCQTDLVLTLANDPSNPLSIGEQHYSASNSITSTREIMGGLAEIIYSAGNFIDMKPGFLAEKNNFMIAKPDGCPD